MKKLLYFFFTLLLGPCCLFSQSTLHLDSIMKGDDFVGHLPESPWWSPDGLSIYFRWNPDKEPLSSLYQSDLKGNIKRLSFEEIKLAPPSRLQWDDQRNRALFVIQGDLFLYTRSTSKTVRLTTTSGHESSPQWSKDGQKVIYAFEGNLFARDLLSGHLEQLTDLRSGTERKDPKLSPGDQYLQQDQLRLFEVIAQRKQVEELNKARRDSTRIPGLPKIIYTDDRRVGNLQVDPSLTYVTYTLTQIASNKSTTVGDYVTLSGHAGELRSRPKVGEDPSLSTLYCYDRLKDTVFVLGIDSLPGILDKPAFMQEYAVDSSVYSPQYTKPRPVTFHGPIWSSTGRALMEIKSVDNKDRWIALLDPESMSLRNLDHQRDTAWIGGPGISGSGNMGWLGDGETCWFQSEVTGFSHLYTLHVPTGQKKALTSGNFEVYQAQLSKDKRTFFLRANAETPFEQHFYHLSVEGGKLRKITTLPGFHDVEISPDETMLAIRYSASNKPWELYFMENKPGASMRQITHSLSDAFKAYPWRDPEIVMVPASDGVSVPARLYRPDPVKANGAGVIFVHGAGYLQNVHRWWSNYYREYMFHHLLCDEGYTVLDMDFRASSGYGRDWRTAIYRHMGGRDLEDNIDGARYLVEEMGVFKERIGIYGGSYGGFITMMALFKYPGTFACGAALRSVTDWAHYNHGYTSNILNTPLEDSVAYRRSSPMEFAEGLNDPLLILHGMVDVNVQFQDVVRLNQRLIELGKQNWEMALYPVEDHGFKEASSWADEYRRIYRHFQTYLR